MSYSHNAIQGVIIPVQTNVSHPWRDHFSKVRDSIDQVGYSSKLQLQHQNQEEDNKHANEDPWDSFW